MSHGKRQAYKETIKKGPCAAPPVATKQDLKNQESVENEGVRVVVRRQAYTLPHFKSKLPLTGTREKGSIKVAKMPAHVQSQSSGTNSQTTATKEDSTN